MSDHLVRPGSVIGKSDPNGLGRVPHNMKAGDDISVLINNKSCAQSYAIARRAIDSNDESGILVHGIFSSIKCSALRTQGDSCRFQPILIWMLDSAVAFVIIGKPASPP